MLLALFGLQQYPASRSFGVDGSVLEGLGFGFKSKTGADVDSAI